MKQTELGKEKKAAEITAVSKALSSIYTGVFFIDLLKDSYDIISSPSPIISMLTEIESAQQAINYAIAKYVKN